MNRNKIYFYLFLLLFIHINLPFIDGLSQEIRYLSITLLLGATYFQFKFLASFSKISSIEKKSYWSIGYTLVIGLLLLFGIQLMSEKNWVIDFYIFISITILDLVSTFQFTYFNYKRRIFQYRKMVIEKQREIKSLNLKYQDMETVINEKVVERTSSVNELNEQIKTQNDELLEMIENTNEMSSVLDKEVWQEKRKNKLQQKERIIESLLTYEDFTTYFTDANSCLELLSEIKWSEGYACKKCNNPKSMNIKDRFIKKCSKCGAPESATSYTLYHGTKFPLSKAFYLTYVYFREYSYNTVVLAKELHVRTNTCQLLKEKVIDAKKKYTKKKSYKPNSWIDLIYVNG